MSSTERQRAYMQRQRDLGRVRRNLWATPEEWDRMTEVLEQERNSAALSALCGPADYQGIARACTATVQLSTEQAAAVLLAYDRGLDAVNGSDRAQLDAVLAQLKDIIWP